MPTYTARTKVWKRAPVCYWRMLRVLSTCPTLHPVQRLVEFVAFFYVGSGRFDAFVFDKGLADVASGHKWSAERLPDACYEVLTAFPSSCYAVPQVGEDAVRGTDQLGMTDLLRGETHEPGPR
jgi:hypothetical protein